MNLKAGLPYSLVKNGLQTNYPKLGKNIRVDVVVVGGGISGALTSWHLAKKNIDCLLIDGRTVGLGSTCASSSLLLYEIDTPLYKLQEMLGPSSANRSYELSQQAVRELISIAALIGFPGIEKKESIYYAAHKKDIPHLKKEFAARKKLDIDLTYVESSSVKKETGIDSPAAIISRLAAQTDAYLFTHALLADSINKGLQVYDRTKMVAVTHSKNGVKLTTENGFLIHAKKIVYATGYESIEMIPKSLVKLKSTFITISESFTPEGKFWNKERLAWNTADPYLYFRTTPDKRIMIGGRDEDFYSPIKRNRLIPLKTKQLTNDFNRIFPGHSFIPEFSWAGSFGTTHDGLPFIGTMKTEPNSYFALGFGGNGISFSVIAAKIITDLIIGKKNRDADLFAFDR